MHSEQRREFERKVLNGDTAAIRRFATEIRANQKSNDPEVLTTLLEALQNAQGIGKRIIIQSLPMVPEIEPIFVRLLETGHSYAQSMDGFIQADAVQKLGKLATPYGLAAIRTWTIGALAAGERHQHYACVGLRSLANARDSSSRPIIHECLNHIDPHIRSTAIDAVRTMHDRTGVPNLIELLSDKSKDPQVPELLICDRVALVLGDLGDVQAVEPLAAMVEQGQTGPSPDGAIYALTLLGQAGRDALRDMLARVDEDLRNKILVWLS